MKKLLLFFLLATSAYAQNNTAVQATVVGPSTLPWANATAYAALVCPGNEQAYIGTFPIPMTSPTVKFNPNGFFSQVLYNTSVLVNVQGGSISCQYQYHITDQCGTNSFISNSLTGITGSGPVDLSAQINATAPNSCAGPGGGAPGLPVNSLQYNKTGNFAGASDYLVNSSDTSVGFCAVIACQSISSSTGNGLYINSNGLAEYSAQVNTAQITDTSIGTNQCVKAGAGGVFQGTTCGGVALGTNIQSNGTMSGVSQGSGTTMSVTAQALTHPFAVVCSAMSPNSVPSTPPGFTLTTQNNCYYSASVTPSTPLTVTQTLTSAAWTQTLEVFQGNGSTPVMTNLGSACGLSPAPGGGTCSITINPPAGGFVYLNMNAYQTGDGGGYNAPLVWSISDNQGDTWQVGATAQQPSTLFVHCSGEFNWFAQNVVGGPTVVTLTLLSGPPQDGAFTYLTSWSITNIAQTSPTYTWQASDTSKILQFEGSANINFVLPDPALTATDATLLSNAGTGNLTITATSPHTINGNLNSSTTLTTGQETWVVSDGSNYYLSAYPIAGTLPATLSYFTAGNFSPLFTTTVTSPSSTPNLGFTTINQGANLFYASPSGSSGAPGFRNITTADMPSGVPTGATKVQAVRITSGICTTSGAETKCTMTGAIVWPTAFADTSYAITCSTTNPTGTGTNPGIYPIYWANKTTTGADLIMQAGSASAAGNNTVAEIDCIGVHP